MGVSRHIVIVLLVPDMLCEPCWQARARTRLSVQVGAGLDRRGHSRPGQQAGPHLLRQTGAATAQPAVRMLGTFRPSSSRSLI